MKKPLLFLTVLCTSAALHAADFEGKVSMQMTGSRGEPQTLNFSLARGLSRIDMQAGGGHTAAAIFDPAKQEMTILMPEQRMYMVQSVAKPMESAAKNMEEKGATLEQTSEHEKILGYDCTKWVSKSNDGTTEMWVTDQLGTFMGLGAGGNPMGGFGGRGRGGPAASRPAQPWEEALKGKDFFPLRVVTKNTSGKESFRMEAKSVEKQSLPASLFQPPADYKNLSEMMRGMGLPGMIPGMGK